MTMTATETPKKNLNVRIDAEVIQLSKSAAAIGGVELKDYVQETLRRSAREVIAGKGRRHEHTPSVPLRKGSR